MSTTPLAAALADAPDSELSRRVAAGDSAAFEALMRRYNRTLFRTARAVLRDDSELFLGSQGLRTIELDRRREVGIILRDRTAIKRFRSVFEEDWATTKAADGDESKREAA